MCRAKSLTCTEYLPSTRQYYTATLAIDRNVVKTCRHFTAKIHMSTHNITLLLMIHVSEKYWRPPILSAIIFNSIKLIFWNFKLTSLHTWWKRDNSANSIHAVNTWLNFASSIHIHRVVSLEICGNFLRKISWSLFQSFRKFPENFRKFILPENFRKFLLKMQYKPSK